MRNVLVVVCFGLLSTLSAVRADAAVFKLSTAGRPYGTYVLLTNQTFSDNPVADAMLIYGIGVQSLYMVGPFFSYPQTEWFDVPVSEGYCMWWTAASPAYGIYLTSGAHRMFLNDLSEVDLSPPDTLASIFLSYIGA
jgi:hypothetical protein